MKKLLLITAVVLTSAFAAAPRSSAQSASFTFTPSTPLSNLAPGSTIQFSIFLNVVTGGTLTDIAGLTYFLQQTSPATFPPISIFGRDRTGSPFSDPITADSFFNVTHDPLNASASPGPAGSNSRDLGALIDISAMPLSSGTYFVANITLNVGNSAGTYTVQSTTTGGKRSIVNDSTGFVTFPISPGTITFSVVPEPSTYALMAVGGIALAAFAYRRRALS